MIYVYYIHVPDVIASNVTTRIAWYGRTMVCHMYIIYMHLI